MSSHLNVEIKARCANRDKARQWLLANHAEWRGTDVQTDTYFRVSEGRLKLRSGPVENALIFCRRSNDHLPKDSQVTMAQWATEQHDVREVLREALGVLVEVRKRRDIFFIGNVKFHLDDVPGLGHFIEIEAIDKEGSLGQSHLLDQCRYYMRQLGIHEADLQPDSYSDMLLKLNRPDQ